MQYNLRKSKERKMTMKTIFKEINDLCISMIAVVELLEEHPQLPVLGEKLRFFSDELKRIAELKPAAPQSYVKTLSINEQHPILVMCLEQAKDRMDGLNENSPTYDVVDELKSIISTLQNFADSVAAELATFDDFK